MLVFRPARLADLSQLVELAALAGVGLTTLQRDAGLLEQRIAVSQRSFQGPIGKRPGGESFFFVLEDTTTSRVVGTSGVVSKVGGFEPFYAYRIHPIVHESQRLNIRKEISVLHLVMEHNGPSEIGSLFLHPAYQGGGNGRFLSLSRFVFMAEQPEWFEPVVIAEMRGVIDEQGNSPFWSAVGKHFFDMDLSSADYLSLADKRFIAELMPRYPIYIPLLPPEARAVIGVVHPQSRPALQLLEQEGFSFSGMVDIFEAGPVVSCRRDEIRTLRYSRRQRIAEISAALPLSGPEYIIASRTEGFRACKGPADMIAEDKVRLPPDIAAMLEVRQGDEVRMAALRPAK
jgi:arginine N-succinyltransferase